MVATAHPNPSSEDTEPHTTELHLRVRYAALRLESGDSPAAATKHVMHVYGIDEKSADLIVMIARRLLREAEREADRKESGDRGARHLVIGGLTCFAGIAIAATTGGSAIATCAILVGSIQFIAGLVGSSR